jgi:acyl carrier protein
MTFHAKQNRTTASHAFDGGQAMSSTARGVPLVSEGDTTSTDAVRDAEQIQAWLIDYLARLLEIPPEEISVVDSFDEFGLDSAAAVGLTGDLGRWFGRKLEPTLPYDYPTIGSLSAYLAADLERESAESMRHM